MEKPYHVTVDENYEFSLTPNNVEEIDQAAYSKHQTHVLYKNRSFAIEIAGSDFLNRKYSVKVNGNTYKINIATQLDQLISEMGLSLGNDSVKDEIHAPMPGIILEVSISEGAHVEKGDALCVLEAMKMENTLTAPRDGIIKSVNIAKGDTVDKGKLLIEFEKND